MSVPSGTLRLHDDGGPRVPADDDALRSPETLLRHAAAADAAHAAELLGRISGPRLLDLVVTQAELAVDDTGHRVAGIDAVADLARAAVEVMDLPQDADLDLDDDDPWSDALSLLGLLEPEDSLGEASLAGALDNVLAYYDTRTKSVTLLTATGLFAMVLQVLPEVAAGARPAVHLFELFPGLAALVQVSMWLWGQPLSCFDHG
jgi:hypothetical protein